MKVKTFFDNEFKLFSVYDNVRSIPSLVDGLKVSQRKAIYGFLQRGENAAEMKVENASNYIASVTDYHHGAQSLCTTIVNLAQNFTGSNNINLLEPVGQFGSRLDHEAGAPRYIFTHLSKNFRTLFKKEDDIILDYLHSDSMQIEPKHFYPILPMVLVNGAKGTGTGYACSIFNYNPEDLKNYMLDVLATGSSKVKLIPWFRNFNGKVIKDADQTIIEGVYKIVNPTTIHITELPVGTTQDTYREHLNELEDAGFIKNYTDSSTESGFDFMLTVPRSTTSASHDELMKRFKLISRGTETFSLWDENNKIKVFSKPEEIVDYFTNYRIKIYDIRRSEQIKQYDADLKWIQEKLKFIRYYISNSQDFAKKNRTELEKLLTTEGFVNKDKLLQIRIYNLTKDEIEKLEKEEKDVNKKKKELEKSTSKDLFIKELNDLVF